MFWLLPKCDDVDDAHGLELQAIASLGIESVTTDDFGPAFYERREDALRVKAEIEKQAPKLRIELMG